MKYRTVAGGTATADADYASVASGTLQFADGEYLKTFAIPLVNDAAFEGDETVRIELFDPAGAALHAQSAATVTIVEPMVARLAAGSLGVPESGGSLPVTVVLDGESGQTLAQDITVSLTDLLSGTAQAGLHYAIAAADATMTFPAGSPAGTTRTASIRLIDNYTADPTRTIQVALGGIDSFAAVADDGKLAIHVIDGATLNAFDDAPNYTGNFREVHDGALVSPNPAGHVSFSGSGTGGTALYDTTPLDGAAVDIFGGGTSTETYSLDFRAGGNGGSAGIYARVSGSSAGGYLLSLAVNGGAEQFVMWKNASVISPGSTDVSLFQYAVASNADFASAGQWYTLVFTLQTNPAGTAVTLSGKVSAQGDTGGTPLAEFAGVDASSPIVAPGQTGFRLQDGTGGGGSGAGIDMDNFTADAALTVAAGESATLTSSHYFTSLAVNGTATLPAGAAGPLVTRGVFVAGQLDLADNDLIVDYTGDSPLGGWDGSGYTGVTGLIETGHTPSGTWDGPGIGTSMEQAVVQGVTGLAVAEASDVLFVSGSETALWEGRTVDATTVIVKYTYTGDLNLDGVIDGADYGIIDNYVQFPGTDGYANGDFNYDGVIDGADYGLIDNAIQLQGLPL